MIRSVLIAGIAAVLLVVGAAIPALAVTTQHWEQRRIATEAFDAAAQAALDASSEAAGAHERLATARDAAGDTLDDSKAVASAAAGFFAASLVADLQSANTELEGALATEAPDGAAMPDSERPESVDELTAGVDPLTEWAAAEQQRADDVTELASQLHELEGSVRLATAALVTTVATEASAALGAAPIASVESRKAVENARDAVAGAVKAAEPLAKTVGAYGTAVAAMRASQQAAADAAAAAAAEQPTGSSARSNPFSSREWAYKMCQSFAETGVNPDPWPCTVNYEGQVWVFTE